MLTKVIASILVLLSVLSCSVEEGIDRVYVGITGARLDTGHQLSCFQLQFASDSLIVVSSFSQDNKLEAYYLTDDSYQELEFLRVGRGPYEVLDAKVKYRSDTLYVMSTSRYGVSGFLSIPLAGISNEKEWDCVNAGKDCLLGADFAVVDRGKFIALSADFDVPNIMTYYDSSSAQYSSMGYWPDDGFDDSNIAKQLIYMRTSSVFANGHRVLFASGEGCFASLIDFSSVPYKETLLYSDFPEYKVSEDGVNPRRISDSALGMYSFATDSYVFLSPLKCRLRDGSYLPADYKGYPPYYTDEIDVFDWDGLYLYTFRTDVPFGSFFVNETEGKLYILTQNAEDLTSEIYVYEIAEYL